MSSPTEQQAAPLSRRELRELEREAERRKALETAAAKKAAAAKAAAALKAAAEEAAAREAAAREAAAREAAAKEASAKEAAAREAAARDAAATEVAASQTVSSNVDANPVYMSRRERREAELAAAEAAHAAEAARIAETERVAEAARVAEEARLAEVARVAEEARIAEAARAAKEAAERSATTAAPVVEAAVAEPVAIATAAKPVAEEPVFLSRRERREAERRAAEAAVAKLEAESLRAAELAVARNPELFAKQSEPKLAPVVEMKPAVAEEKVFLPEVVDTAAIETLDVKAKPVVLAPVVSLDEVRAARAESVDIVPSAPKDEPEVEVPEAFRAKDKTERADRIKRSNRAASSAGRVSGGMVALSLVAGTVVLGAGSAAGFSMLNSGPGADETPQAATVDTQSLVVGAEAADANITSRVDDVTAVTSIGTAAAANLATGVQLPDKNAYVNNITANVQWPFPMGVQISSEYGYRDAPTAGASSLHGGVDLTPGLGTPIGSIADGVVTDIDNSGISGMGLFVEVEHMINGERVTAVYGHLNPDSIVVKEGQEVSVGDEIAQVGNTGVSTGPHLHFEVHIRGKYVDPVYFLTKLNVAGVKTAVPSPDDGVSVALGTDEKLLPEDSHAFVDELFSNLNK
ncbi:M23 family metallopeptidase [Gulosibacter molinativorax]|uniref:M23ase beta-sheet core domain-containing protein n=1 Tax=Gulosibacter molinativorax TaxID=256821 RepID=A0ABT7CAV4_9MICO|nr:M23 family metallopeptidase [Gulosibacter molinativorax]MDJ1372336.1 hypothetical protein [Gulosibacter molinativorax]QUY63430.1 Murein DD-endopeptidase MepM [Gulosibacter molinativorax]